MTEMPEWYQRFEQAMHGHVAPGQRFVAEKDPEYMEAFLAFTTKLFTRPGNEISPEVREVIVIAIQAALGAWDPVRGHTRRALVNGVSPKMILEGMEIAAMAAGVGALFGGA
ncbi:MAG TPA: carboxymuconolactone decarboxylase family protein, partial [Solirubrobacteraceae bacterium]|nr:carboxymuconolactone decarboxylase family protein [Solirubrobacteraceae bacterium]